MYSGNYRLPQTDNLLPCDVIELCYGEQIPNCFLLKVKVGMITKLEFKYLRLRFKDQQIAVSLTSIQETIAYCRQSPALWHDWTLPYGEQILNCLLKVKLSIWLQDWSSRIAYGQRMKFDKNAFDVIYRIDILIKSLTFYSDKHDFHSKWYGYLLYKSLFWKYQITSFIVLELKADIYC